MADKIDFAGMGDDERAKKDLAAHLAAAKKRAAELSEMPVSEIQKLPDALVGDVLDEMCGTTAKGERVAFVNGPHDGVVEFMKDTPETMAFRTEPPQIQLMNRKVAVSVFYEVAVYLLSCDSEGRKSYRFDGYSECMEGL